MNLHTFHAVSRWAPISPKGYVLHKHNDAMWYSLTQTSESGGRRNEQPPTFPTKVETLTDAIVGFCRFARDHGFSAGIDESIDALHVARLGILTDRSVFRLALRALLCTDKEEWDRFDVLFEAYWGRLASPDRAVPRRPPRRVTRPQRGVPMLMIGVQNDAVEEEEEGKTSAGANAIERLRMTDFSNVPLKDQEHLEQLARRLWKQMNLRLARRLKATRRNEQVDLRRTIRKSIPHGGVPLELCFRGRKPRKLRLVILLDVSGSMDPYSFFLLRFVHALQHHFLRIDSFLFSTRLTCITDVMKARRLPALLATLAETDGAWSSGTRIGACLQTFNEDYGRRVLTRNTLVLILSDGLDTGEPELLSEELRAIKKRVKKLIWLNPLLGMDDYQPLTRGIQAALPHVDFFLAAHNLDSLLNLETHLRHV